MSLLKTIREVWEGWEAEKSDFGRKSNELTKKDELSPTMQPWTPHRPEAVVDEIGAWPIPWRQRWGELCNQFEDEGVSFPESERHAYYQVKQEMRAP
jgi:hypothetical protein